MITTESDNIRNLMADTDVFLLEEFLKGRLTRNMKILDAGCGMGRNISFFMQQGFDVYGLDISEDDIAYLQKKASGCGIGRDNFRVGKIEENGFQKAYFDYIICHSVLHFAKDEVHFNLWLQSLNGLVAEGGFIFIRLCTKTGMEAQLSPLGNGWYRLPDGAERFLADENLLKSAIKKLNLTYAEPMRTEIIHGQKSISTIILSKA